MIRAFFAGAALMMAAPALAATSAPVSAPASAPVAATPAPTRDTGPLVAGITGIFVLAFALRRRKAGLPEVVS